MSESNTETPSQVVAKAARPTASHTDSRGRLIVVSTLSALEYYRFTKAMGASSSNTATMDLAALAATVRKIDTTDFAIPATERDVEFLIQQLDFDGIAAAAVALDKLDKAKDASGDAELDTAKN